MSGSSLSAAFKADANDFVSLLISLWWIMEVSVLKNWNSIRWDNSGIQVFENIAVAMGNYYFTNSDGTIMVEFSFVY